MVWGLLPRAENCSRTTNPSHIPTWAGVTSQRQQSCWKPWPSGDLLNFRPPYADLESIFKLRIQYLPTLNFLFSKPMRIKSAAHIPGARSVMQFYGFYTFPNWTKGWNLMNFSILLPVKLNFPINVILNGNPIFWGDIHLYKWGNIKSKFVQHVKILLLAVRGNQFVIPQKANVPGMKQLFNSLLFPHKKPFWNHAWRLLV